MIESILEHRPWVAPVVAATLTTAIGSPNVTGTGLNIFVVNDLIWWTDAAGVWQQGQVKTVTSAFAMILEKNSLSVSIAVIPRKLSAAAQTMFWFRADNSVIRVPIIKPGLDAREQSLLGDGAFNTKISMNEGILIKSVYTRYPYQYTMGVAAISIGFYYVDAMGALIGRVRTIGEDAEIFIPSENGEVNINAYVPPPLIPFPATLGTTWQISAVIENCLASSGDSLGESNQLADISQVDAPTIMNGQQIPIVVGCRILHASTFLT